MRCPASNHLTSLVTAQGKPFTAAGFGNYFRDLCREAGLPERCTSHGLRKAAATYLAELGFTDHQLMAWFGWTSISQAQVYTRSANRNGWHGRERSSFQEQALAHLPTGEPKSIATH